MELFKLNYPVKTANAKKFWGSRHICNRMQCIIAFSLNLSNANDNLRRAGYSYAWRKRALLAFGAGVNKPTMPASSFKFAEMSDLPRDMMSASASLTKAARAEIEAMFKK